MKTLIWNDFYLIFYINPTDSSSTTNQKMSKRSRPFRKLFPILLLAIFSQFWFVQISGLLERLTRSELQTALNHITLRKSCRICNDMQSKLFSALRFPARPESHRTRDCRGSDLINKANLLFPDNNITIVGGSARDNRL